MPPFWNPARRRYRYQGSAEFLQYGVSHRRCRQCGLPADGDVSRARAVREALVRRGIPRDGLRANGIGSQQPVDGLAPTDPANRRIEFSVIRTEPLRPTPVDTPGAR